jgi:hypothetical protein
VIPVAAVNILNCNVEKDSQIFRSAHSPVELRFSFSHPHLVEHATFFMIRIYRK